MSVAVLNPVFSGSVVESCETEVVSLSRDVSVKWEEPCERVCLNGGLSLEICAFVALVPRQFRLSLWARLSDAPTASQLLGEIELLGLRREVDTSYGFVRNGTEFLVTRDSCPGWLPIGYLLDNGPGELGWCTAQLPVVEKQFPEGYCYLSCVVGGPPSVLGSVFGPFPKYVEVSPFLRVLARADINGQCAHLSAEGRHLLSDVAEADTLLGGVCYERRNDESVLRDGGEACPYCLEGPCSCVEDARGAGVSLNAPHVNVALDGSWCAPDYVFLGDKLCTGATLGPGLHTFPSNAHECNGEVPYMWFSPYWTIWLPKGVAGRIGRFRFDGTSAVWIVGRGACSFTPRDPGRKLCLRVLSHHEYLKYVVGRFEMKDGRDTSNFSRDVGVESVVSLGGLFEGEEVCKDLPLSYDPGIDQRDMGCCFQTQSCRLSGGAYSVDLGRHGCVLYAANAQLSFGSVCAAPGQRVHFVDSGQFDRGRFRHVFKLSNDDVVELCRVDEDDSAEILYGDEVD